ncbi:MAG: nucleotidyltransferase domain-containing protein [Candidatus Izemoplasmatales bacterium]|jgi:hypothetical protein|nr:nucleotidyltransferase domain-containing protein [Candidatus Izemoplasmatales bacterium]
MDIKSLRKKLGLTQVEAAKTVNISLRSYKSYENDISKVNTIKYDYILSRLTEYGRIDEEKGILSLKDIRDTVNDILQNYEVEYCYLFGSYSKGNARENSDVDLLLASSVSGLDFYGLVEKLRTRLHKKVDLLTVDQLKDNFQLINDILKEGIKIYG